MYPNVSIFQCSWVYLAMSSCSHPPHYLLEQRALFSVVVITIRYESIVRFPLIVSSLYSFRTSCTPFLLDGVLGGIFFLYKPSRIQILLPSSLSGQKIEVNLRWMAGKKVYSGLSARSTKTITLPDLGSNEGQNPVVLYRLHLFYDLSRSL